MANPGKGGKGKKAPYGTVQHRIPLPLKGAVTAFADRYRELIGAGGTDPTGENLIRRVESAIRNDESKPVYSHEDDSKAVHRYADQVPELEDALASCQRERNALREEREELRHKLSELLAAVDQLASVREELRSRLAAAGDSNQKILYGEGEKILAPQLQPPGSPAP